MDWEYITDQMKGDISDMGISLLPVPFRGFSTVISLCMRLSDGVIDEIETEPTLTYFHHYRCVNRALDDAAHKLGRILQREGYDYYPVAASQSANERVNGKMVSNSYSGIYSHKQAAVYCGLGHVGKNNLFIHDTFGARVRLCTVFTDFPTDRQACTEIFSCLNCDRCVSACPSGAISDFGKFDPEKCSSYMKQNYQHIGRGSVCGLCISACPLFQNQKIDR